MMMWFYESEVEHPQMFPSWLYCRVLCMGSTVPARGTQLLPLGPLTTHLDHGISGPTSEAGKPKLYELCHGFQHVNYFTFRDNYAHIAVCFCARAGTISHTKMLMQAKLVGSLLIFWKEIYVPPVWMLLLPSMKSLTEEEPKRKRKKHHHSFFFCYTRSQFSRITDYHSAL